MLFRSLIALPIGLLAGALAALGLVFGPAEMGGLSVGPWKTNALIGSSEAGPIVRAVVARRGLLALNREETVYYTAWTDSEGEALDEACAYELIGPEPQARWWSVTLYAADDFLPVNGTGAYSATADTAERLEDGNIRIQTADPGADGYIATRNAGRFSFTLRLYNPHPVIIADLAAADLPRIERLGCEGAS